MVVKGFLATFCSNVAAISCKRGKKNAYLFFLSDDLVNIILGNSSKVLNNKVLTTQICKEYICIEHNSWVSFLVIF